MCLEGGNKGVELSLGMIVFLVRVEVRRRFPRVEVLMLADGRNTPVWFVCCVRVWRVHQKKEGGRRGVDRTSSDSWNRTMISLTIVTLAARSWIGSNSSNSFCGGCE